MYWPQDMLVARSLMKLHDTFGMDKRDSSWTMRTTERASPNHPTTTIRSTILSKYPKFQSLAVAFRVFRSMIPKLKEWVSWQECQALDPSDFYSDKYWINVDEELEADMEMVASNDQNSNLSTICSSSVDDSPKLQQ